MSFTINFMKNSDEVNKINKSPETITTLTGTLKKETSIVNPVILIEYAGTFTNCNYAYIESFSRYYYITDIKNIRENLWEVYMHCDVLKTFSEGILASSGIIARQENSYNLRLDDDCYKCYSDPLIVTKVFPNGFNKQSYVLAMLGSNKTINQEGVK